MSENMSQKMSIDEFKQQYGLRQLDLGNCSIAEDLYMAALGEIAYRNKCKELKIKPSPFTLNLIDKTYR